MTRFVLTLTAVLFAASTAFAADVTPAAQKPGSKTEKAEKAPVAARTVAPAATASAPAAKPGAAASGPAAQKQAKMPL